MLEVSKKFTIVKIMIKKNVNDNKFVKSKTIKITKTVLPKFINDNIDNHYYYTDTNNKEWEFLEIKGSTKIIILNVVQVNIKHLQ